MMPVVLYALILLVLRAVSMWLIADVIKKQRQLRKRPIKSERAGLLREQMHTLAVAEAQEPQERTQELLLPREPEATVDISGANGTQAVAEADQLLLPKRGWVV